MRAFLQSFGRRERIFVALGVLLTLAWYGYTTARVNHGWVTREPLDYYPMLADAFLSGQTYLKLAPDARLQALPDPWAGPQGVPRAHDASYFDGHYYLYFGVAPVILLYAPWRLLTGTFLVQGVGTGIFCAAGFLLAALFFLRCRRRFFPGLGAEWSGLAVLTLGLGSFVQVEIEDPQFYQVPIACAFACAMGAAHAVLTALTATRPRNRALGLAAASLLWGTAVAARPNYLVGLVALAGVAGWLGAQCARREGVHSAAFWRLAAAAVVPAALVGAGLAAYNYVRFGNIFEFGLKYQLAAIDMRHFRLFGGANLLPALRAYLGAGKDYSVYYPFVHPVADTFGLLPWAPFALLALAFPGTWRRPGFRDPAWIGAVGFLLTGALAVFGSLAFYFYRLGRYELDFLPGLMLGAVLVASAFLTETGPRPAWRRRLVRGGVAVLLGFTLLHSFLLGLPDAGAARRVARWLDYPAFAIERLAGIRQGPVAMDVEFPAAAAGRREPLVVSGRGRDEIYVRYGPAGRVQFGFDHSGAGGVLSEPVAVAPGRRYRLVVDLGGLYPPPEHPAFRGWTDLENEVLHRRVRVTLDGRTVLQAASGFYASDPFSVQIGGTPGPPAARFSGRILEARRLGLPSPASVVAGYGSGPVRLTVRFPAFRGVTAQPLVCTGRPGAGDLVYVLYLAPGLARFGHDSWNGAAVETAPVYFDPGEDHVIDVDMGSLYPEARGLRHYSHRFQLRFDGRTLISVPRPFNPSRAAEVVFGYNAIGASTADVLFNGPRLEVQRLPAFPEGEPAHGARFLSLALPRHPASRQEPLLVTGRTGAGDLLYVGYLDATHIRFGYDHWGVGGPVSDPIPIPPGPDLELEISLGSLYPAGDPAWAALDPATLKRLRSTVQVRLNGRVVFQQPAAAFPAADDEIYVGRNPIGGSTCGPRFSGRILQDVRIGAARLQ
jgi:hypothetical protein